MEVTVIAMFDISTEGTTPHETKKECVAKALQDVVETVLNKHFENDERVNVSFVTAESVP